MFGGEDRDPRRPYDHKAHYIIVTTNSKIEHVLDFTVQLVQSQPTTPEGEHAPFQGVDKRWREPNEREGSFLGLLIC